MAKLNIKFPCGYEINIECFGIMFEDSDIKRTCPIHKDKCKQR